MQRVVTACSLLVLGIYVYFHSITAVEWKSDEVGYRNAGVAYLRGSFELNTEHPFLVKYLFGAAQLAFGDGSPLAVRSVSALGAVLTTGVVYLLTRSAASWNAGVAAALLWIALPHPVQLGVAAETVAPKLERLAGLESVTVLFLAAALVFAWRWMTRWCWADALLFAVFLGLAGASKATAVFAIPAVLAVLVASAIRDGRLPLLAAQLGPVSLVAALVVVASYIPDVESMPEHVMSIVTNAATQRENGHAVIVAGKLYDTAPWWSLAYWQWAGQGSVVTAALVLVCAISPFRRRIPKRFVALMLLSIAVPFAWISFGTGFILSHYSAVYQVPLAVLAALVVTDMLRGEANARLFGAGLGLALLVSAASTTIGYVSSLEPAGYALLTSVHDRIPEEAEVAVSGNGFVASTYLPGRHVTESPVREQDYDAVIVDSRYPLSPVVEEVLGHRRCDDVFRFEELTIHISRCPSRYEPN